MLDIQQKRKLRSFLYSKFTLGTLFLVVLLAIHSTWSVYKKKKESEILMKISQERVDDLKKRSDDLDKKIERLNTEVGVEEEIRTKFSVTKENEAMVVIVQRKDDSTTTKENRVGFWQKVLNFLGI